jgi:rare lipoprotein A
MALPLIFAAMLSGCSLIGSREPAPTASRTPAPPAPSTSSVPTALDLDRIPDAIPRQEPRSARGNPLVYEVFGKRYQVLATSEGYKEQGIASWYGKDFHARPTSSGEPYDMYAMTAAHKTLPLPCYARVTNLDTGKQVVVRINDRGPFVDNRIIDLSYTAAHKLGMVKAGTAFVEVEVLTPGTLQSVVTPLPPTSLSQPALFVQIGAFAERANATQQVNQLQRAGIAGVVLLEPTGESSLHRVRIGPLADVASFDALMIRLQQLGISGRLVSP